ncbi:MAG: RNA-binding S4 domain-containing protein [Eubacteriales bacterium]|nr:RNA-binding S4 domain-containing protein [Eubacteriales bacterium]
MRLDKYLKLARVIKRRTIANEMCDKGKVSVNGKVAKAYYEVQIGDQIGIIFGEKNIIHEVRDIPSNGKKQNK